MTRTDVHRPSAPEFDPEGYELRGVFDLRPEWPTPGEARARIELVNHLIGQGYRFAGVHPSDQCGHCGAHIRYAALMVRPDVAEMIYVGETCLDNRFSVSKTEFAELRKRAAALAKRHREISAHDEACAAHPALAYATYARNLRATVENRYGERAVRYSGLEWGLDVATDIMFRLARSGKISDAQIRLVGRIVDEQDAKLARFAEREAARLAKETSIEPLSAGRQEIEGVVVSRKAVNSEWGVSYKMLVKLDSGQRVYGTEPSSLQVGPGSRVRFTATVTPATDEPSFGFYSRPTKAEALERTFTHE